MAPLLTTEFGAGVHPGPEELSLSLADEPSLWPRSLGRAHRASCSQCRRTMAALSGVTETLASTQAPPMSATLAARLDGALAGEVQRRGQRAELSVPG